MRPMLPSFVLVTAAVIAGMVVFGLVPVSASARMGAPLCALVPVAVEVPPSREAPGRARQLQPRVEEEEEVYGYTPANNGAGPMWCSGSTCLIRSGDLVFASGLETLPDAKPLNNCRWTLFRRGPEGWRLVKADPTGRTREPSPLVTPGGSEIFLSVNPTLSRAESGGGPAQPAILKFLATGGAMGLPETLLPAWDGKPDFTEHSYRSFAADARRGSVVLFQNIGYTHAEYAFRESAAGWVAKGQLRWPTGKEYPKPEAIRVCYPNVAVQGRAVYFCGVSDIIEPYPDWRAFKKELTGQQWDYDFRRLFFTWTPDIVTGKFAEWVEVASRDKTCGWISPGDLWVGPGNRVHLAWSERALDERLRARFFPGEKQSHSIGYAVIQDGRIVLRRTLLIAEEGKTLEIASSPRFQVTPDDRLFLFYYVSGRNEKGEGVSENRLAEIQKDGQLSVPARVPFKAPFTSCFTATTRGGSPASDTLEVLGQQAGAQNKMSYGRVRLF